MSSFIPTQGSVANRRTKATRAAVAQNQSKSIRSGHVAAMRKAVSSPESVRGDPQYIALRQQINDITRTINRINVPEEEKAELRESIGALESELQAFINSRRLAVGGRRRSRKRTLKNRRA
jgi:hypothetical protein